jgi:hypothetical protein
MWSYMPDDERSPDGRERRPPSISGRAMGRVSATRLAAAVLVCAYAWWAVALPPFSSTATVAVLLAGAAAAIVGVWVRSRHATARRPAATSLAPWALLAVVAAAWQLAAYLQEPRNDHPTFSSLANAALDTHATRAVAFVAWLLATVEIARR